MNRCPISYLPCGDRKYAPEGLRLLARGLNGLSDFPYTAPEQRMEASGRMSRMSIQGVQPKLSAVLNTKQQLFDIVEFNGRFIIKPQHEIYAQMPENEDLTMRMAATVGIETPLHGMIWCKDGSLSYFVRRFDRVGRTGKRAVEDFAQLAGLSRETKYDYTLEKMIGLLEKHCTFPVPEKFRFFRLVLFCFLTGNEDMHLKNFSLITRDNRVEFSPAYDLLNTTLVLGKADEEMALLLSGKRKGFHRRELVDYLGRERLGLPDAAIQSVLDAFQQSRLKWDKLIDHSFLGQEAKKGYRGILENRFRRLLD